MSFQSFYFNIIILQEFDNAINISRLIGQFANKALEMNIKLQSTKTHFCACTFIPFLDNQKSCF